MSAHRPRFRWTARRLLALEAGLLVAAVVAAACLTAWMAGPGPAAAVLLQGALAVPVFLLAEAYARRRRRERERRAAEDFERRLRELGNRAETRIK